jgi:type VI secretion system secreted protein Hcp
MQDLSLFKELDKASPKLMEACATGSVIPRAVLMVRKDSGDAHLDYLVITMENVRVSSLSIDSTTSDTRPTEHISLNFTKIEVKYIPQDPATGRPLEPVIFSYDLATGTTGAEG